MLEKTRINTLLRIIALGCSVILMYTNRVTMDLIVVTVLACLCVFTLQYYLGLIHCENLSEQRAKIYRYIENLVYIVFIGLVIFLGIVWLSPVLVIFIIQFASEMNHCYNYIIGTVISVIYLFLFVQDLWASILDFVLLSVGIICIKCLDKIKYYKEMSLEQRQHIILLEDKIKNNDKLIKSIKYAAILEERNRLAVRLHDKIGHNISGSIIMLEASMLNMDKHPDKAKESMSKAVENLRTGVDDIRQALREERPVRSDINSNDIQILLNEAKMKHEINTLFYSEGNLDTISLEMWKCIKENTTELLTNTLKHSNGNRFAVNIKVLSSMVKVTYGDNGITSPLFVKGIGLEAVEERTIKCNGKCFFKADASGFLTTTVFVIQ